MFIVVEEDEEEEPEVEDDEGVVFDLDEELGFDEQKANDDDEVDDDEGHASADEEESSSYPNGSASNGSAAMIISTAGRSLPKSGAPIAGSLRASYLRRQRGLEQHRRSVQDDEDEDDFGSDDNEDDLGGFSSQSAAQFGTSLPIMIQRRTAHPPPPPTTARAAALASSLAMPPGSSPAAAMLQRRLSRAYGSDVAEAAQNGSNAATASGLSRSIHAGSYLEANPSAASGAALQPIPGSVPGTLILDPLMLLEEEHDRDDQEDRLRKRQQPFSSINNRRDREKIRQQNPPQSDVSASFGTSLSQAVTEDGMSLTAAMARANPTVSGSFLAENFEPPHLYSARTYVGDTPWEMPTRITVKSGGMQREGSHLDQQIAREMAKEMEKDRKEQEATAAAALISSTPVQRTVGKILEEEEEEAAIKQSATVSGTHPFDRPHPTPDTNEGSLG